MAKTRTPTSKSDRSATRPRIKDISQDRVPQVDAVSNLVISESTPDLVEVNGHVLFRSIEVEDWLQAIQEEREARLASLAGAHNL